MDWQGRFEVYRANTSKILEAQGQMDLVVALCTPTLDGSCHFSRQHVWTKTAMGVKYVVNGLGENTYLDFARNRAVELTRDCAMRNFHRPPNYYLWLDQDNVFPDDLFFRLHKHNKDIVSASYVRKGGTWQWVFSPTQEEKNWETEGRRGLVECRYVGFGACLVKGEVFEKLAYPWFKQDTQIVKHEGKAAVKELGEDVYFCEKAREAGYKVWVDTDTHVGHMGACIWPKDAYVFHKYLDKSGQQDYIDQRGKSEVFCESKKQEALA